MKRRAWAEKIAAGTLAAAAEEEKEELGGSGDLGTATALASGTVAL